jgi:hypothetical protein
MDRDAIRDRAQRNVSRHIRDLSIGTLASTFDDASRLGGALFREVFVFR